MTKSNELIKIIEFLKEAEKLKLLERIPYLSDRKRRENDAEHSWYVGLMLLTLENRLDIEFDLLKTYQMIIVHDLVEIYTGDDWIFEKKEKDIKKHNETRAAEKLFSLLPKDLNKKFYRLWSEYDTGETVEAKIAKALDKISYTLQYNISKKIEWNKRPASKEESRNYALPHIEHNETLLKLFDTLLDDLESTISKRLENGISSGF